MTFTKVLMKECIAFVCMSSLNWTLDWLALGGTQNSAFVLCLTLDYWSNGHDCECMLWAWTSGMC